MEKMSRVTTALGGSALTGRTMHCHLDAPANAISVCRDAAQVVVAGRSIFKIYAIEDEQFVEKLNLRVGRKPSLNLSCADVVWHQMDENLLATAATNGVVVTWNLGRPSRNKQDQLFTEHKRTVNKVCFHPTEAHVLLSGSQDGFMKCFDLRRKDSVSTFSGEAPEAGRAGGGARWASEVFTPAPGAHWKSGCRSAREGPVRDQGEGRPERTAANLGRRAEGLSCCLRAPGHFMAGSPPGPPLRDRERVGYAAPPPFFSQQAQLLDSWPCATQALSRLKRPHEAWGRTRSRLRALGAS